MAANTKAKKEKKAPNLKMRKAVRRTFAGLFMASAIMVAAIPARDTTAKISESEVSEPGWHQRARSTNQPDAVAHGHE